MYRCLCIAETMFFLISLGDMQGSSREFRSRRVRSFVRVHQQTLRHKKEKRRRQTARVHNWCGRSRVLERNTGKIQSYVRKTIVYFFVHADMKYTFVKFLPYLTYVANVF